MRWVAHAVSRTPARYFCAGCEQEIPSKDVFGSWHPDIANWSPDTSSSWDLLGFEPDEVPPCGPVALHSADYVRHQLGWVENPPNLGTVAALLGRAVAQKAALEIVIVP